MPTHISVQHTYNHKSGLPADGVVNTFYFRSPLDTFDGPNQGPDIAAAVLSFYDTAHTGMSSALRSFIAETTMATQRHSIKVYDLGDAKPRAPLYTLTSNNGTANNSAVPMPAEVALCLSYRGALESGTIAARRRGRVYIGPLVVDVGAQDASGHHRPSAAIRTLLTQAAKGLQDVAATEGWEWVVRSYGGGDPEIEFNDVYTEIQHVWCDDSWDTQRRRGPKPTTRTTLNV